MRAGLNNKLSFLILVSSHLLSLVILTKQSNGSSGFFISNNFSNSILTCALLIVDTTGGCGGKGGETISLINIGCVEATISLINVGGGGAVALTTGIALERLFLGGIGAAIVSLTKTGASGCVTLGFRPFLVVVIGCVEIELLFDIKIYKF